MAGVFWFSDEILATIVPIAVYWIYSGLCCLLQRNEKFRLHSKEEEAVRNTVSKATVVKFVLFQQFLQASATIALFAVTGNSTNLSTSSEGSYFLIPLKFLVAMLIMDAWQYFMHSLMHRNQFLYRNIHSFHHRLVVPYSFGALYNHPIEALLLDTTGGAIAFFFSRMSPRTSIIFFSFATAKTVDDHCGLWIRGNPFHLLFSNNTAYHDIHHQFYGAKYNLSQPFFVIWDKFFGTYMPYSIEKKADGGLEVRTRKRGADLHDVQ